jgi:hypothetical protein
MDSKPWTLPGPHIWVDLPKRLSCALCCKREKLKRKFMNEQEAVGIEVFKTKIEIPRQVWSGCGYCGVPLCKKGSCFKDWHTQK